MDSCAAAAREDGDEARRVVVVDDPGDRRVDQNQKHSWQPAKPEFEFEGVNQIEGGY